MTRALLTPSMKKLLVLAAALAVAVLLAAVAAWRPGLASTQLPPAVAAPAVTLPQSRALYTVRRLEGDVTGDCMVNVNDDQEVARRYLVGRGSLLYSPMYDINLPTPDRIIDISDLQFVFGRNYSTCTHPIPPQPPIALTTSPAAGPITLTKVPATANIWICQPGAGLCAASSPAQIGPNDWLNGIVVDEVMTVNVPQPITAYTFELKYAPAIFQPPTIADQGQLDVNGAQTLCTQSEVVLGDVTFRCVTSGPPASWTGPRTVAKVTLLLRPGVASTIRPAKENGIATSIFDVAVSAGGPTPTPSPTAVATVTPTATSTRTATPVATDTPPPTATPTAVPTSTLVPTATRTPAPTATMSAVPTATNTPASTATAGTATPPATATPPPQATGVVPQASVTASPSPLPGTAVVSPTITVVSTVIGAERQPPSRGLPNTGTGGRFPAGGAGSAALAVVAASALALGSWALRRRRR
ncbi:MAG: hypothetical protein KGK07_11485 [Chloroflexota bacterium]|nr:hypothetical protein [Chloroflexota bacterium]